MKVIKSLLLGSAAGLVAVAGAQAADLPSRKAAPVEYVRVCSAYGEGYFYIPGTDTCLRLGGRVRAEYRYETPYARANSATGFRTRAILEADARTQTSYGTLRTFIRFVETINHGVYGSDPVGGVNTGVDLNKAFIQFAGITAGRTESFFDFYADALNFGRLSTNDTYGVDPVVLAYTATFGSGFSATISLEDPTYSRAKGANAITYAGQRLPDVVGNLSVTQGWGQAQLSGVVHQMNVLNRDAFGNYVDTEYGYGVLAGVKLNLPMLAAGDQLWLQASYAEGAVFYVDNGNLTLNRGEVNVGYTDGIVVNGDLKKTKVYNVLAALLHYWTPTVRQAVFASYERVDAPSGAAVFNTALGGYLAGSYVDANLIDVGTNIIWSPVKKFDIGVEVMYHRIDPKGRVANVNTGIGTTGSTDSIEARLRFQRDF